MSSNGRPNGALQLERAWSTDPRWEGIVRPYGGDDVIRLRGSIVPEHTLARVGAERLWNLINGDTYVSALGALTGGQAVQMVKAGLQAIYLSGWQVAADANIAGQTYPDQSLYPANSVPAVVKRINQALQRADQIAHAEGNSEIDWFLPIIADAEAGFGGPLNVADLVAHQLQRADPEAAAHQQQAPERRNRQVLPPLQDRSLSNSQLTRPTAASASDSTLFMRQWNRQRLRPAAG